MIYKTLRMVWCAISGIGRAIMVSRTCPCAVICLVFDQNDVPRYRACFWIIEYGP